MGGQQFGAAEHDGGHILAHTRGHEQSRVVAGGARQEPGQQVPGQLALRQRQPEPHDGAQLGQPSHDEVAVGGAWLRRLSVAKGAVIDEVGGQGARCPACLCVQYEVAHDQHLLGTDAHRRRGVQHAVRRGFGRQLAVVSGDDHIEVGGAKRTEAAQGALDGAAPVTRMHAHLESLGLEPLHERLGAFVGRRGPGGGELEALQRARRRGALVALRQREDPLEHELVRRAADVALDGREVERAGVSERAVEVEEDGTQPERPCGAHAGMARRPTCRVSARLVVHRSGREGVSGRTP